MIAKCNLCHFTATCNSKLKLHQLAVHSDLKPWPCTFPGCNYRTKTKFRLKLHSQRSHETNPELRKPFPCTFEGCDYRAAEKSKVKFHVKAIHTPGRTRDVECILCASRFFNKPGLTAHLRTHVKERQYKCNHCDYTTHLPSYLPRHVRDVHQRLRTFTCTHPGCNFSTNYKSGFTQHSKRHDPDVRVRLPHACDYPGCEYRARNRSRLKEHTFRRHNPSRTKEFTCHFCAKAFHENISLMHHMNMDHLNEKAYKCEKCHYSTAGPAALKLHQQKRHDKGKAKTKNLVCDFCDFRVVHNSELDYHTRAVHMKEMRYKCSKPGCNYGTFHPFSFKNHLLTHEEDSEKRFPLACTYPDCDFRRRMKPEMKAHERNHKVSKLKLKCGSCCRGNYPDFQSVNFHSRMNHGKRAQKGHNASIPVPIVRLERVSVKVI